MAAKSKRIKDKLLLQAYSPNESDEEGNSDGKDFAAVVGNRRFHSFQVWRKDAYSPATYVYGLRLRQIQDIVDAAKESAKAVEKNVEQTVFRVQREANKPGNSATNLAKENEFLKREIERQNAELAEVNELRESLDVAKRKNWFYEKSVKSFLRQYPNAKIEAFGAGGESVKHISIPQGGSQQFKIGRKRH